MAIKLYGNPYSTSTRRVAAVFNEKNVPYELVPIDVPKGEHKLDGYIAKQPFGQVPYIDDDGFVLYESRAIAWYIAAKYRDQGTPLLPDPADIKATAVFKQAVSVEESNFEPYANGITTEVVFKPMRGAVTDQKLVDEWSKTLDAKLDAYEVILSKQKYVAGDSITLADLFHLPYGQGITGAGFKHLVDPKRPNLVRWWKEISARPAWVAVKETA